MNKVMLGVVLGVVLGAIDGYGAKFSAPEVEPELMGIIIGSTFKGLIVGALIGWYALKVHSLAKGVVVGLLVSAFFAFLIAAMPNAQGGHYWVEIILPGAVLGMIVGYATQKFGNKPSTMKI